MKDVIKDLFNAIFSFGTVAIIGGVLAVWMLVEASERERVYNEICYARSSVLVKTDAGYRCAAPEALTKVN